jgi:hypothetical protein
MKTTPLKLRLLSVVAVLAFTALACVQGAATGKPALTEAPPAEMSSASETPGTTVAPPAETPGGTEPPATPAAAGLCENQYFPVLSDATWSYDTVAGPVHLKDRASITSVEADGFDLAREINPPPGNPPQWTEPWDCTPEGLVRNPSNSDLAVLGIGPGGTETVTLLSVDGVTLPKSIQGGDTWTQVLTFELATPDNQTLQYTLTYEFTAGETGQVTVPAGTFDALRLDVQASWVLSTDPTAVSEADVTEWLVPEVGLVKWTNSLGLTSELVDYDFP